MFPAGPIGNLVMDSAGNLFGVTGDISNDGTIFELAKGSSSITTLATFNGIDGNSPNNGLVIDPDGNLYGSTNGGGAMTWEQSLN